MSIHNNLLAKLAIQDITSANSARAAKLFLNTLFDTKSIINFYAISSSFPFTCYHSKECKNSNIKDNTS